jgi:D-alanyl-D-alanine carboxypeptidase
MLDDVKAAIAAVQRADADVEIAKAEASARRAELNVLVAANADETRHPASLTKMMTLYMVFEALREGRLSLDSRITFSAEAASRPPSNRTLSGVPPTPSPRPSAPSPTAHATTSPPPA